MGGAGHNEGGEEELEGQGLDLNHFRNQILFKRISSEGQGLNSNHFRNQILFWTITFL